MQVCQGGLAVHQHPTPDEGADTTQDDTELVDAEQWSSGRHTLRVAQRSMPLKGSPRYLALSDHYNNNSKYYRVHWFVRD